jgi:hypothetical protein
LLLFAVAAVAVAVLVALMMCCKWILIG